MNAEGAELDFHEVGWFNTVVPGGGQFLLGKSLYGVQEFAFEVGAFGVGYALSARSPLTIDGVPENYPALSTSLTSATSVVDVCKKKDIRGRCIQFGPQTLTNTNLSTNASAADQTKAVLAAFLQEVGLKAHMHDVFNSYRDAYKKYGGDSGQGIDMTSSRELYLAPFNAEVMRSPWVWAPLLIVTGATVLDYTSQINGGISPIQKLTAFSNSGVAVNQLALYPVGSGAPEEMFYRGFIQNEAYHWIPSPFFAIPFSTAAFALSHGPDGHLGASISGSYLGFLAYKNHGALSEGIALHFWSVFVLGVESLVLTLRAENVSIPITLQFGF